MREFPERDWKVFREVADSALEQFCEQTLRDVQTLIASDSTSAHERYRALFALLRKRDKDIVRVFDDIRRSTALTQLLAIRGLGLLRPEQLERFSDETRQCVVAVAALRSSEERK